MPFSINPLQGTRNYFTLQDQEVIRNIAKDILSSFLEEKKELEGTIDKKTGRYYFESNVAVADFLGLGNVIRRTICKYTNSPVGSEFCCWQCKDFVMINEVDNFVVCKKCFDKKKEFSI